MTIDYRARQKGRAIYLIAGQTGLHTLPHAKPASVRGGTLPSCLSALTDLDFLDPSNPFFVTDRALFSYGQFIGKKTPPGIFSRRPGVTILGDSGGFQLIEKPALWQGNATRADALAWLEANTDEAMTLDIPTRAIGNNPLFPDFNACLTTTLANNAYFHKHRSGSTPFLSVLQGRTRQEAIIWLDVVKARPFEGWAVGGTMRLDFLWLVELIIRLRGDGLLGQRNRLHVLGISTLTHAVLLSALQKSVAELPGEEAFQITFDTSNPSQLMSYGRLYGRPRITGDDFMLPAYDIPRSNNHSVGSTLGIPIKSSRISERVTIGDLCAVPSASRNSAWDSLATGIVTHHNLDAMLSAFDEANSIMELPSKFAANLAPIHIVKCYQALRAAFQHSDPLAHVWRQKAALAML